MADTSTTDFNLNAAQCIQSASHLGHTTYTNICKGTDIIVWWGFFDWLGAIGATLFCATIIVGLVTLIFFFARTMLED